MLISLKEKGSWSYAEVWTKKNDTTLSCSSVWYCDDSHIDRVLNFRKSSESTEITENGGAIGKVLATKKALWFDVVKEVLSRLYSFIQTFTD